MRHSSPGITRNSRPAISTQDKVLAKKLAAPDVDHAFADKHVARACLAIQSQWTEAQRIRAAGETKDSHVEVTVIALSDFQLMGKKQSDRGD